MTLILTEISAAGIAMAADSAISKSIHGKLVAVDQIGWEKLLYVSRIKAGISYWGAIGLITSERFDHWLQRVIDSGSYSDVPSFADYLAQEMNKAAGNKPLPNGEQAGIHVAGYQLCDGGALKPAFYHIHNGHSEAGFEQYYGTGALQNVVVRRIPVWKKAPRELFKRHDDFIPEKTPSDFFENGRYYICRNGDFAAFDLFFENFVLLVQQLNTMDFGIPNKPAELGPRIGFLKTQLEIMIALYRCSSITKSIGGKVLTLGIKPDGEYWMQERKRAY